MNILAGIDGLYPARFLSAAPGVQADQARPGVISFEEESPARLAAGYEHPALLIPVDQRFGLFVARHRPRLGVTAFARRAGISLTSLYEIERGDALATLPKAAGIYQALGGSTLCLAFFEPGAPDQDEPFPTQVVDSTPDYAKTVGTYFAQLRGTMSQREMGQATGINQPTVSKFESGEIASLPATVAQRFNRGVNLDVAFCGIGHIAT